MAMSIRLGTHAIVDFFLLLFLYVGGKIPGEEVDTLVTVEIFFLLGRNSGLGFMNWDAAHGDPPFLARGSESCLRHSRIFIASSYRDQFFIRVQDGNDSGSYTPASFDLGDANANRVLLSFRHGGGGEVEDQ